MDRYKFRGKRLDNGEWVEGNLIGNDVIVGKIIEWDSEHFLTEFWFKVDPSTVGQYTGLKDKNGKEIYEGDITQGYSWIDVYDVVRWDEIQACFWGVINCRVIGNIHDNPELLKGV